MDLKLEGKRAIVTGGSLGIGRCCALALAREGSSVCVVARDRDRLDRVVEEIAAAARPGTPWPPTCRPRTAAGRLSNRAPPRSAASTCW